MPSVDLRPRKRHPRDKRPAKPMPFDVALRKFKKSCERARIVQEVRKREYYEKPSSKRKRQKDQAIKKTKREIDNQIMRGEWMPPSVVGQKHLKGKREKRKAWAAKERIRRLRERGKG